jgi:hypothetical protein
MKEFMRLYEDGFILVAPAELTTFSGLLHGWIRMLPGNSSRKAP